MSILLVCGDGNSGFLEVFGTLERAGLAPAEPSKRERFDPLALSESVCVSNGLDPDDPATVAQIELGKVWQALSVDLMLANMERSDWGWADPRLVYMLEHWRDFDPQVKFVLVYRSPEQTIAEVVSKEEASPERVEASLALWTAVNSELLRFYHANRDRCLLVNTAAVCDDSRFFLGLARDHLKAKLVADGSEAVAEKEGAAVFELVASLLVETADEARDLFLELESSADIPGRRSAPVNGDDPGRLHNVLPQLGRPRDLDPRELAMSVWDRYRSMRRNIEAAQAEVEAGNGRQEELRREVELLELRLVQSHEELEASFAALGSRTEELQARTAELDTVRRELESVRGELDEQRKIVAARETEVGQLAAARDAAVAVGASLADRLAEMTRERDAAVAARATLDEKLAVVSIERDEIAREKAKVAAELQAVRNESSRSSLDAEAARAIEAKLRDLGAENELLNMQLVQVQEELEFYFEKSRAEAGATPTGDAGSGAAAKSAPAKPKSEAATDNGPVVVDMRSIIDGEGWYYAEHDGRWSGPEAVSRLRLPRVAPGVYTVELDIVDAMTPAILRGITANLDGRPLKLRGGAFGPSWRSLFSSRQKRPKFPVVLEATAKIAGGESGTLEIRVPETVSPSSRGSNDTRRLGIRLRRARLVKKED